MAVKKTVNLDALIRRQDLETPNPGSSTIGTSDIPVSELVAGKLHYGLLRKPDFQRETDDWDIDNVVTLIKSFRDGDLIPALIMWRANEGYSFVIDGAHRLSALIAWVNDDYGDRAISQSFYGYKITDRQKEVADECRKKIAAEVGTYLDLSKALNDSNPTPERIKWASNISAALKTQWVVGDAANAEKSFIAINQRQVQIDDTERYMISARRKPNVIAARALIRCATGHEYWAKFNVPNKEEILAKAQSIHDILFQPESADMRQTIEMPIAGKAYSADSLRLTLDLINYANDIRSTRQADELVNDEDGTKTVRFLAKTFGVVKYLSGDNPSSLGLHPSVYFWGPTGKHHPSAFLAVISLLQYLLANDKLIDFCKQRARFEEFLVKRGSMTKYILGAYGGWRKSAPAVFDMYRIILDGCMAGLSDEKVESELTGRFNNLGTLLASQPSAGQAIKKETRIAARRAARLTAALRCKICHARLPSSSVSDDHILRIEDGGTSTEENLQLTHKYCNHGFKEWLTKNGGSLPPNPFSSALQGA